jgi:hypothetical protein
MSGQVAAAPPTKPMNSRRLIAAPVFRVRHRIGSSRFIGRADVRFGSKADILRRNRNVRFAPESGHSSVHGTPTHFAPEAEIQDLFDHYISNGAQGWRHLKLECLERRGTSVGGRITGTAALKLVVQSFYF